MRNPPDQVRRFYEELGRLPGAVGRDENGAPVRRAATGEIEPVRIRTDDDGG